MNWSKSLLVSGNALTTNLHHLRPLTVNFSSYPAEFISTAPCVCGKQLCKLVITFSHARFFMRRYILNILTFKDARWAGSKFLWERGFCLSPQTLKSRLSLWFVILCGYFEEKRRILSCTMVFLKPLRQNTMRFFAVKFAFITRSGVGGLLRCISRNKAVWPNHPSSPLFVGFSRNTL